MKIKVTFLAPVVTKCPGHVYNRQRATETIANSKGCGCYLMDTRRANITMTHDIKFYHHNSDTAFEVERYIILKFSLLFQYPAPSR